MHEKRIARRVRQGKPTAKSREPWPFPLPLLLSLLRPRLVDMAALNNTLKGRVARQQTLWRNPRLPSRATSLSLLHHIRTPPIIMARPQAL
jgi:hypothetical protein